MTGFSKRFNTKEKVILGASVLLLLITLTFPFNYDHTIFMIGGEKMVLHGGIPFRDVLDTKPLMIMYLYGFSSALFGHSMVSIRILDLIFQLLSLYFVYRISITIFTDKRIAPYSALVYALFYVSFDYTATAQAETFALLPALFISHIVTRSLKTGMVEHPVRNGIAVAFASVFISLLKVSLVVIPISLLGFLLLNKNIRDRVRFVILSGACSVVLLSGFLLYLHLSGSLETMMYALKWLSDYSNFYTVNTVLTAKTWALRELPLNFIFVYSLTGLILLGTGFYITLKKVQTQEQYNLWSDSTYVYLFFIVFVLCFLTIIYERKFWGYSFTRLLFCSLPFIIVSLVELRDYLREAISKARPIGSNAIYTFIGCTTITLILFFSPIYSIADRGVRRMVLLYQQEDVLADLRQTDSFNTIADQRDLSDTLKKYIHEDETIYIWGSHIGAYYFLDIVPPTFMTTSVMLISPWTPVFWKEQVLRELTASRPKFFIVEHLDYLDIVTGYKYDSHTAISEWKQLHGFLRSSYDSLTHTHNFSIFLRRNKQ